jgi:ComF family protein
MGKMRKIKDFLLDLMFPVECLGCGKESIWVCDECFKTIPLISVDKCPRCQLHSKDGQTCLKCRRGYYLDGVVVASDYNHPLIKKLIINLKYNYVKDLAKFIAEIVARQLRYHGGFIEENWSLVPVPLHRKRLLERGFNQSELLCWHLNNLTGLPIQLALKRIKNTLPQASLQGQDRLVNIKESFSCESEMVKNKKLLLIDDIFTTGATLNEGARVLKQVGVKEVWGLVAAKG